MRTRIAPIEQTLSDNSIAYGVRFFCDYDPEVKVEVDCLDQAHAQRLIEALEDASCIGVIVPMPA